MALEVEDIVGRFQTANTEHTPQLAVRDVLQELIASRELDDALGPVELGGLTKLYGGPELSILRVVWTPGMHLRPHNHNMWAVIGMYGGTEDNLFYRREGTGLAQAGGKEVHEGDVVVLGHDIIHSVANTRQNFAAAIHVYGGDFFNNERSEWDFETMTERPRDIDGLMKQFSDANERWLAQNP